MCRGNPESRIATAFLLYYGNVKNDGREYRLLVLVLLAGFASCWFVYYLAKLLNLI